MKQTTQSNGAFFRQQEGNKTVKLEEMSPMAKLNGTLKDKPKISAVIIFLKRKLPDRLQIVAK